MFRSIFCSICFSPVLLCGLTLEEAESHLLKNNHMIKKAEHTVSQKLYEDKEALAYLLPDISFSMGYTKRQEASAFFSKETYSEGLTLSQPLFNQTAILLKRYKKNEAKASHNTFALSKAGIVFQLRSLYVQILHALAGEEALQENARLFARISAEARDKFDLGAITKLQYSETLVAKSKAALPLLDMQLQLRTLLSTLQLAMGKERETSLDKADIADSLDALYEKATESLPTLPKPKEVLHKHRTLKALRSATKSIRLQKKASYAGYLPTLTFSATLDNSHQTGDARFFQHEYQSKLNLALSWKLFDTGQNYFKGRALDAGQAALTEEYIHTKQSLKTQLHNLILELDNHKEKVHAAKWHFDTAQENQVEAERMLDLGQIAFVTYQEATKNTLQAKESYFAAMKDYLIAHYSYERDME